ncbi:RHS repeat-associated core domain-containing protein [Tannerella forsythia]|uniref:RHS repeat-associated core domain-containing protein n=1 Tax=Tannerella forsythia TaxID=28112 RepID=UPI000764A8B7|nr:RHS repeat-associated core domain-containing protein [Tannerella forsythia]
MTFHIKGRISKTYQGKTTRWVWDGNVPLHEWTEESDVTTWLFEEGTFIPAAKIVGDKSYSIITDYLGTPTEMYNSNGEKTYNSNGEKTWSAELDIYGSVRNFAGRSLSDCPFRYQGQYEDEETGLYYNRFRYYSPDEGRYISQEPIGLEGGISLYGYVNDCNSELDQYGESKMPWHHLIPQEMLKNPEFMRQLNAITGGQGRNYINRQGAIITENLHKSIHKGAGGGAWNETFENWFEELLENGELIIKKGLQNQLKKMMKDFNIPKSPRIFARKYKRKSKKKFKPKHHH